MFSFIFIFKCPFKYLIPIKYQPILKKSYKMRTIFLGNIFKNSK